MNIKEGFVSLSATDCFGIDKLKLFTDCFEVGSIKDWNVQGHTKKAGAEDIEPGVLFSVNGAPVYGSAAYINKPGYSATIKHGKCIIDFNPSKFFHPYHLTTDQDKIATVLKTIETDMRETLHTDIDLMSTGVSRLDITAQAVMSKTVPHYDQVIKGARSLKRAPKTDYPHGFLMGNKTRQLCTYDKGLKLEIDQGVKTTDSTNLLRIETRALKATALKEHTPFKHMADVLTAQPGQFKETYLKTFNALLRIEQQPIQFAELSALTDLIQTAQKTYSRQWLQTVIIVLSAGNNTMPTPLEFEQAMLPLVHAGVINRTRSWRNVKKYQKLIHEMGFLRSRFIQDSATNYADLHKEFTDTFINQYKTA